MKNTDGIFHAVWDKEERVEGADGAADMICVTSQEFRKTLD